MSSKKSNTKKRQWAFVCYPESLPPDWIEILKQSGLQCAISPLHDKDINPDNTPKKPHYHVILVYAGPTTYNNVATFTASVNGTIPQPLEQVRGYYRYLTHKDNPEKAQYDEKDIITLNGFDIREFVELTKAEILKTKREIQQFIIDNEIFEYAALMDCLLNLSTASDDLLNWYDVASSNTLFFSNYIKSRRYGSQGGIHAGGDLRSEAEQIQPEPLDD